MRFYFQDTHNVAEGAGAAPLAAAINDRHQNRDKRIGLVLTGGNVDLELYNAVLSGAY
jgi:threonine dehydratase